MSKAYFEHGGTTMLQSFNNSKQGYGNLSLLSTWVLVDYHSLVLDC